MDVGGPVLFFLTRVPILKLLASFSKTAGFRPKKYIYILSVELHVFLVFPVSKLHFSPWRLLPSFLLPGSGLLRRPSLMSYSAPAEGGLEPAPGARKPHLGVCRVFYPIFALFRWSSHDTSFTLLIFSRRTTEIT